MPSAATTEDRSIRFEVRPTTTICRTIDNIAMPKDPYVVKSDAPIG